MVLNTIHMLMTPKYTSALKPLPRTPDSCPLPALHLHLDAHKAYELGRAQTEPALLNPLFPVFSISVNI